MYLYFTENHSIKTSTIVTACRKLILKGNMKPYNVKKNSLGEILLFTNRTCKYCTYSESTSYLPIVRGEIQRPTELPKHITLELFEMAQQLNKEYSCPICVDLTDKETIHITWCGHVMCKECYEDLHKRKKD